MTDRPVRVVHVITRLVVGGAQENTILSCAGLRGRGFDVTLVTGPDSGPEGSLLEEAESGGYRVLILHELRRAPRPLLDLLSLFTLWRFFRHERPDIVHTHSSKAGILGRAAAWMAGVPVILHTNHGLPFHDRQSWFVNRFWRLLERLVAPATTKFICVSEAMKRASIEARLAPPDRHEVVYSGMEMPAPGEYARRRPDFRWTLALKGQEPLIGWIGRLAPQKSPADFLEVLDTVIPRVKEAHAVWVGDGPLRTAVESEVRTRPWAGRVQFKGRVPPPNVPGYLAAMDVFVLTSHWEGLPRVAAQAALAGLPVVAYDVEGAAEVVRHGETGFLVPVGDRRALAERVIEVLSLPDRGRAMGKRGREFVGDRFDVKRMVSALHRIYGELS
jgi:glycosyltransferase involved in cell wall biosynthesis